MTKAFNERRRRGILALGVSPGIWFLRIDQAPQSGRQKSLELVMVSPFAPSGLGFVLGFIPRAYARGYQSAARFASW